MAVRSIVVKKPLINMMARRFPDFPYVDEWAADRGLFRIYGFVRRRPGCWYDYLTLCRRFEDGKGALSIDWDLVGIGCNPDFYAWSTGDLWRVRTDIRYDWGDLFGPSRPQTRRSPAWWASWPPSTTEKSPSRRSAARRPWPGA